MDKNISVLVVEDILSARETVIHLLRALGFSSFVEAENGAEALDKLDRHPVGLIISDWNMPRLNGLGLLRAVRARESVKQVPFVFLTSRTEVEDVALASDLGVSGYLIKPVTIKAMAEVVNRIFSRTFEQDFEMLKAEVRTHLEAGDPAMAEELLRRFEQLHPAKRAQIRFELAKMLMDAKDFDRAEVCLRGILETTPLFAKGWEMLARVKSWQAMWDEALLAVDQAIAISPNNTDYHLLRGTVNLHRGDMHEARKRFMTALNIDRKNDQIKQDIWNAYVDLDLVDEVQREFGSYIFSSLNCDTLNNMAVAYRRQGELGRAVEIYRAALVREPDNPKILFNAAVAYMNRKQYAKARDLLLHALGNDPEFEKAKALLVQIDAAMKPKTENGGAK